MPFTHTVYPKGFSRAQILLSFLLMFCGLCTSIHSSYTQVTEIDSVFYFSARIVSRSDDKPVQFAHIINRSSGRAMISDTLGYFTIRVQKGDFLTITSIGYYDQVLQIRDTMFMSGTFQMIYMIPRYYPIQAVEVNPLGTYEQFKLKMLNLQVSRPREEIHPKIIEDIEKGTDTLDLIQPLSIMSPISALYFLFSKEGKSIRKMAQTLEKEELEKKLLPKIEIAERITGLSGVELQEFLDFCNFETGFFLSASEYEIGAAILECFEDYQRK